ncbi:MAG: L-rhamnose isomerase [Kiritimatiellaeota bacterium]|nr:L-rhamnose isomerase [Kiritimatiellota bacterium]
MQAKVRKAYALARAEYAALGVDTEKAIRKALAIPISMHGWQADDVAGFEVQAAGVASGGILATGNYPGRARTGAEARADYEQVLKLVPGRLRLNLHAIYAETGGQVVERDELRPRHFVQWMEWGRKHKVCLDFNPTFFAHPKADSGFTLSSTDPAIRKFWVRHAIACRRIAQAMAKSQGAPCVINHWIPDGAKDFPADRWTHRALLTKSLDEAVARETSVNKTLCVDFVESKLFGIGSEEYVVGSAEYYSSYALSRGLGFCLDMGHWHPTETIHDKLSALLPFHQRLLIHVSRPMRWDSDHVVVFNDDLRHLFLEIQRGNAWPRVALATDYFDASINRIAAYTIGLRATRKAILYALLDPSATLRRLEAGGDNAGRLALMDEMKTMPFGAVWAALCGRAGAPADHAWMRDVQRYERRVLSARR